RVAGEVEQELELEVGEVDLDAGPGDRAGGEVDLDVAEAHGRAVRRIGGAAAAAQDRADPRHQLGQGERLGDVVVGAEPERGDLVVLPLARRQHDDRGAVAAGAQ